MSGVRYMFVSDRRHMRRIMLTNDRVINSITEPHGRVRLIKDSPFIGRPDYTTVAALHEPPSWKHEATSYGIVACHMMGRGDWIDQKVNHWQQYQWMKQQQPTLA